MTNFFIYQKLFLSLGRINLYYDGKLYIDE
jgi:hypothetical protein